MKIIAAQPGSLVGVNSPETLPAKVSPRVFIPVSASSPAPQTISNPKASGTPIITPEPLLTFRRDSAGRTFYVITDAQTGKELAQVPPEKLRNVGEGIADYLRQQEARNAENSHIEIKA